MQREKLFLMKLGSQEVITKSPTKPLHMEKVTDPVKEMMDAGVSFHFVDLSFPENADQRN